MLILVTYDVSSTESPDGRRRLRRIAKVCLNYGQRVQKSVFECSVNTATYELLEEQLLAEIDEELDSLRIYRLHEPLDKNIKQYGKFQSTDFDGTLVI
ncbi:MAG: CRISPR-associated endonuclease Cas2 [Granulosicoccus sp.]